MKEPEVTISLKEYNNLLEIKKGVQKRKVIACAGEFPHETYFAIESQSKHFEATLNEFRKSLSVDINYYESDLNWLKREISEAKHKLDSLKIKQDIFHHDRQPWYKRIF